MGRILDHRGDTVSAGAAGAETFAATVAAIPAPPAVIDLTPVADGIPNPTGMDYHEPTGALVVSVNFPDGRPQNLVCIRRDGTVVPFAGRQGFTDEVNIAAVRSAATGGLGGMGPQPFTVGDLFAGNGVDGEIVRITDDGDTVISPWVRLPGTGNRLTHGSLYLDRTGVWGGDLIVVTTTGEVWRIDATGAPSFVNDADTRLEGVITVPNNPARYGPLAGKIIAGNETDGRLYAFDTSGAFRSWPVFDDAGVRVDIQDIDLVAPDENFFGVDFVTGVVLGAEAGDFAPVVGDILIADEFFPDGASGLSRLTWDCVANRPRVERILSVGATPGQWERIAFAPAGVRSIPATLRDPAHWPPSAPASRGSA